MRQCILWVAATVIFVQFWSFFFAKNAHTLLKREEKLWSKFYLNPLIMDGFKGGVTFPELKSNFHNWGAASVMMSTTIAAAKFMNFGCFLPRLLCEQPLPSLVDTRSLLGALRFWWPYFDPQLLHFSHATCRSQNMSTILEKWSSLKVTGYFLA